MPTASATASVERHDAGRDPRRLRLKYDAMAKDAFTFFRATCHLFYERLDAREPALDSPASWICGDLHFENFGSFEGEDGRPHFDLNDFDETCLAPCTWDVVRFQASLLLGARFLEIEPPRAARLAASFVDGYAAALADGRALSIERETATGVVRDLLEKAHGRTRKDLLDRRAPEVNGVRRIAADAPP